jgi:hypothetical protein
MIPQGTPLANSSARCPARANSSGDPSKPRANATASSSDALEERPAPTGRSDDTWPVNPSTTRSSAATASA